MTAAACSTALMLPVLERRRCPDRTTPRKPKDQGRRDNHDHSVCGRADLKTGRDRLCGLRVGPGRRNKDCLPVVTQLGNALADVGQRPVATDLLGGVVVGAGEPRAAPLLDGGDVGERTGQMRTGRAPLAGQRRAGGGHRAPRTPARVVASVAARAWALGAAGMAASGRDGMNAAMPPIAGAPRRWQVRTSSSV